MEKRRLGSCEVELRGLCLRIDTLRPENDILGRWSDVVGLAIVVSLKLGRSSYKGEELADWLRGRGWMFLNYCRRFYCSWHCLLAPESLELV